MLQVFKEDDTYERVSKDDLSEYSQAQVSQLLLRAKLSGSDDIDDFISEDRTRVQLIAMTLYLSSKQLDEFKQKVHELEAIYLPQDMEVTVTGTTVLWANMDKQISRTQLLSLGAMGLFLLLFLPIVFASFRIGVLGVIANLLPLGISLGVMGYLGIEINIATALIGGISLGVVVDDTLHLIHRAWLGLNEGLSWHQAIDNAVVTVGPSITMTSVILIGSFLCMATSDFRPSNHFGIFISISILIAWFLDLFVLPVILKARFIAPKD